MQTFKVIFVRNEVLICHETSSVIPDGRDIYCAHNKGQLIFALVKAFNADEACDIARKLFNDTKRNPKAGDPSSASH